jgi:hypothetical protein
MKYPALTFLDVLHKELLGQYVVQRHDHSLEDRRRLMREQLLLYHVENLLWKD